MSASQSALVDNDNRRKQKMSIEEDVRFRSGPIQLAGTLTLPDGDGPWPGVLLIPGSGQVDRNEDAKKLAIDAFREAAEYLAARGIGTLRYDKRGVGASDGDFYTTGFYDNVADASSALASLRSHERIQTDLTFLMGHSEGALIATRLAATGADVAGVILLAGTAQPGEQVIKWQAQQAVNGMHGFSKRLIDLLHIDVQKRVAKQLDKIEHSTKDSYRKQLIARVNAKWMREFLAYDPAADLPNIHVPVLAITGSKDIQVNPADLQRMAELVPAEFEAHKVPDITHMLRTEPGEPTMSTYKDQVLHPVDSRIFDLVSTWLAEHVPARVSAGIQA
jgi:pimeloyl-ACP methyl ester carboxylesterase